MHMRSHLHLGVVVLVLIGGCGEQIEIPRLASDAVILAFGDSLTYGTGANRDGSYPAVLSTLSGRKVVNAGIAGEESGPGLKRLPALLEQHQPRLMILCHGGNDILRKKDLGQMAANVREMIQLAQAKDISVVLIGVPRFGILLSSLPLYEEIAESMAVVYLDDVLPGVLSDNSLKSDMAHPNETGYRVMAERIHTVLREAGAL